MNNQSYKNTESHLRSIIKGFTWRIIASVTVFIITYLTTGDMDIAVKVTSIEFFVKLLLYYIHERAWLKVERGTIRNVFKRK